MPRLAFIADVHVRRAYVSAVRSNGFRMRWIDGEEYDPGLDDLALLEWSRRDDLVIVSNDADFVALARTRDHAGLIMYQQYGHSPGSFARAITRIDRHLTPETFRNHIEWLENWL